VSADDADQYRPVTATVVPSARTAPIVRAPPHASSAATIGPSLRGWTGTPIAPGADRGGLSSAHAAVTTESVIDCRLLRSFAPLAGSSSRSCAGPVWLGSG